MPEGVPDSGRENLSHKSMAGSARGVFRTSVSPFISMFGGAAELEGGAMELGMSFSRVSFFFDDKEAPRPAYVNASGSW